MLQKAINGYSKFKVSDFEFHLPRPSYTINTLKALEATYPDHSFFFIMGADNWNSISKWKDYQTLLQQYNILIYPRSGFFVEIPDAHSNIRLVNAPLIEISSTFIRRSIREGKDIRFFLPENIYDICCRALSDRDSEK